MGGGEGGMEEWGGGGRGGEGKGGEVRWREEEGDTAVIQSKHNN